MQIKFLLNRKAPLAFASAIVILLVVAAGILPAFVLKKVSITAKSGGRRRGNEASKPQLGGAECAI
jgi:hypothetical protein